MMIVLKIGHTNVKGQSFICLKHCSLVYVLATIMCNWNWKYHCYGFNIVLLGTAFWYSIEAAVFMHDTCGRGE